MKGYEWIRYADGGIARLHVAGDPSPHTGLVANAAAIERLPSGEWVPNLPPHLVEWQYARELGCESPSRGNFPEIPWRRVHIDLDGTRFTWERQVPISREAAGWPPLEEG